MKSALLTLLACLLVLTPAQAQTSVTALPYHLSPEVFVIDGVAQSGHCTHIAPGWGAKISTALTSYSPGWYRLERLSPATRATLGIGDAADAEALTAQQEAQRLANERERLLARMRYESQLKREAEAKEDAKHQEVLAAIERQTAAVEENTHATRQSVQDQLLIQSILYWERTGTPYYLHPEAAHRIYGDLARARQAQARASRP